MDTLFPVKPISISDTYEAQADAVLLNGDTLEELKKLPDECVKLVVTSPPYNIGKEYETQVALEHYLDWLKPITKELFRTLKTGGSICWQVGNFVDEGEVFPLDIYFYPIFKSLGLNLRNRIVWHFDHGLHASKRLSGRYETMLWFTKGEDYTFNLDPIRVPSKYPGKRNFKPGPDYGKPSGNPLGKNPSDIWKVLVQDWETSLWNIPNVKANHPEKTIHPCQFPIELVERCVLALTNEGDMVLDPFTGVASAMLAALKRDRKAMGIDREPRYIEEAKRRIRMLEAGELPYRPLGKPVHVPTGKEKVSQVPDEWKVNGGTMRIAAIYSFNKGRQVVEEQYPGLLAEIKRVIGTINEEEHKTKESKEKTMAAQMLYSPSSLNKAFKTGFAEVGGWHPVRVKAEYSVEYYEDGYKAAEFNKGAFREMDFVKGRLGVEVQFGKYAFMVYNVCAKMTIFKNLKHIDAGVEIVPMRAFVEEMSTGVSYFEQFVWDLEQRGVSNIDIPVMIIGIAADWEKMPTHHLPEQLVIEGKPEAPAATGTRKDLGLT